MSSKKKTNILGYVLASLLLISLVNSGYFFLEIVKLNLIQWLAFNACSLSIIIYLICFILFLTKRKLIFLAIPLLPLYYYGSMGLFITPWDSPNIFAQISHVLISLNVLWVLYMHLREHAFESLGKGLLLGILIFVPVFAIIQSYTQNHVHLFVNAMQNI